MIGQLGGGSAAVVGCPATVLAVAERHGVTSPVAPGIAEGCAIFFAVMCENAAGVAELRRRGLVEPVRGAMQTLMQAHASVSNLQRAGDVVLAALTPVVDSSAGSAGSANSGSGSGSGTGSSAVSA